MSYSTSISMLDYIDTFNSNTILDNKGTTVSCDDLKQKYVVCSQCSSVYQLDIGCDKKTCSACQSVRGSKLYRKYLPVVLNWLPTPGMRIQFLTLTIKNVHEISPDWIQQQDSHLRNFIKNRMTRLGYVFDYGFIAKEMTHSARLGYHYHYHILFYGPQINLKDPAWNISSIWKDVTGDSFMVKLYSKFNNASHALRYLMKYVCKTQETTPEMEHYYRVTKGKRYFQTFGKKYKSQDKKLPFLCSNCGSEFKGDGRRPFMYSNIPFEGPVQVKKINYKRLKFIISAREVEKKVQVTIDLAVNERSLYDRLKLFYEYFNKENNWELIESSFTVREIDRLKFEGYIYETKRGYKLI